MALSLSYETGMSAGDGAVVVPYEAIAYLAASYGNGGDESDIPGAISFHSADRTAPRSLRRPAVVIPADLVARVRTRDEAAFEQLVRAAYDPLVRFARGFVGSADLAEDVVQDVLARVWEHAESWAPAGNPATYLFGTVRHRAIDVLRKRSSQAQRDQRASDDAVLDEPATASPAELLDAEDDARRIATHVRLLETLLATLTERQRTAYDLRYRQGLTIPDIAKILGITTKSGEQLMSRLVRTIRDRMRAMVTPPAAD